MKKLLILMLLGLQGCASAVEQPDFITRYDTAVQEVNRLNTQYPPQVGQLDDWIIELFDRHDRIFDIDYDKLLKYRHSLSKDWSDYILLRYTQQEDRRAENGIYPIFNTNHRIVTDLTLVQWIIQHREFIQAHPKFPLNNKLESEIKGWVRDIMFTKWLTHDEQGNISPYNVVALEYYLQHGDKSSKEYKYIKEYYLEYQKTNFTTSDNDVLDRYIKLP